MAKRKRSGRMTGRKRKSFRKRRFAKPSRRRRVPLALKQHAFVERGTTDDLLEIDTEASATGLFKKFELNTMKQQAQYAQIFEFYRIDKVVVTFRYKGGNAGIASGSGMWNEVNPLLMFKVDHNDDTADSVATLKDSLKCKTHMFTNNNPEFSIQLKPATQDMIYRSATSTAYSPKWGQWIPTNDITVPHYGLKCYAIGYKSGSLNPGKLSVSYKYYVSFKNNE